MIVFVYALLAFQASESESYTTNSSYRLVLPTFIYEAEFQLMGIADGDTLMGVLENRSGWELRPIAITITPACELSEEEDYKGVMISIQDAFFYEPLYSHMQAPEQTPTVGELDGCEMDLLLFMLDPRTAFEPGPLNTVIRQSPVLHPDTTINLDDFGALDVRQEGLFLVAGGVSQRLSDIIVYENTLNGEYLRVVWAGDIDRDGRVDLLFNDVDNFYTSFDYRLFLSSEADDGELVREVTHLRSSGAGM